MKKIIAFTFCLTMLFTLCSCKAKNDSSTSAVGVTDVSENGANEQTTAPSNEKIKNVSAEGYELSYDENVFSFVEADGFDYLISKSVEKENPKDYSLTVKKLERTVEESVKQIEEEFNSNGYFQVSSESSRTFGEKAQCVSALSEDGETVYEAQIVPFNGGVFIIEYHFSTSLDAAGLEGAIYSVVSSFKIK